MNLWFKDIVAYAVLQQSTTQIDSTLLRSILLILLSLLLQSVYTMGWSLAQYFLGVAVKRVTIQYSFLILLWQFYSEISTMCNFIFLSF